MLEDGLRSFRNNPMAHSVWTSLNDNEEACRFNPLVTRGTLIKLDINKIVNNPKLEYIDFDPDFHFRPNLDGETRRIQEANLLGRLSEPDLKSIL
jgi:hypothetical protein